MRVLFCTDGSKISFNSIMNFSKWAKNYTVDIFCAVDWSFLPDSVSIEDSGFAAKCTNSAGTILDYSERFLNGNNIPVGDKIKLCGSAVDSILEIASKNNYDFIVLGSHGKKGIQKWLGSVSQETASSAEISTFISKDLNAANKILFALDNSNSAQNIIEKTIECFDLKEKEIYLTTVYEIPDYLFLDGNIDSRWILEIEKKQDTSASIMLNNYEKIFTSEGLNVKEKIILHGSPSGEIIKYINAQKIDLTICGIRNRKKLSKFLLSSVSKRILENSPTDVAIIRP